MVEQQAERPEAEEALDAVEERLRGAVRAVRTRLMPTVSTEQPTRLERAVQSAPIVAAGVAAGAGLALGFAVRRFVPKGVRR